MEITYKPFKSIQEIKDRGEFLPKGRIIPTRVVKAIKRKNQCKLTTGSNQWAIPAKKGYLMFVEHNDGSFENVFTIKCSNSKFLASPYTKGGGSYMQGNAGLDDVDFLELFNRRYLSHNTSPDATICPSSYCTS